VNSYPSQNHFELFTWYFTCDQIALWNADDGFTALVANVNMWRVMLSVIPIKHQHQNSINILMVGIVDRFTAPPRLELLGFIEFAANPIS
jgi:hypothetical protein